jgi:hypothetical protein
MKKMKMKMKRRDETRREKNKITALFLFQMCHKNKTQKQIAGPTLQADKPKGRDCLHCLYFSFFPPLLSSLLDVKQQKTDTGLLAVKCRTTLPGRLCCARRVNLVGR